MADGSSACARPAAGRRPGIVAVPAKGGVRGRPGVAGAVTARHGRAGMALLARRPRERAAGVFQSRKAKARPVPASGSRDAGCVPGVPAPVRTAGSSAAATRIDREGARREDAPRAVPAMAGAVPEAAALPRPGVRNVPFPAARPARGRTASRTRRVPVGRKAGGPRDPLDPLSPHPGMSVFRPGFASSAGRPRSRPERCAVPAAPLPCLPPPAGPSPAPAALPCADAPGEPLQGVPPAAVPPPAVPVPDRLRGRRERPGVAGADGRRARGLAAAGLRPVAAGPGAGGACSRPCARNGARSRPPGPGDARRTPSGPEQGRDPGRERRRPRHQMP